MRRRKRPSDKVLFACLVASLFLSLPLSSCEYHERFIIQVAETQNPCVGVARFSFVIEALEQTQDPLTSERVTQDFLDNSLYWSRSTGACQMPDDGILLKNIPYGGKRRLIIQAYDSSGEKVAEGASAPFTLEASGDDVQGTIAMNLQRGCQQTDAITGSCSKPTQVGLGTLIIRFPDNGLVPLGTKKLIFQLGASGGQPELIRRIELQEGNLPNFLILTNIPPASGRGYTLHALDPTNRQMKQWSGTYQIPQNPTATTATTRLQANVN